MSLLDWSYIALLVSSLMGAVLFVGYTFRVKLAYPILVVSLHLIAIIATFILFTIFMVQTFFTKIPAFSFGFILVTYGIFVLTFLIGLFFFVRYDLRRKILHLPLLSTHLVMAVLTFTSFTSLMAFSIGEQIHLPNKSIAVGAASPDWYFFHKHQYLHHEHQLQYLDSSLS